MFGRLAKVLSNLTTERKIVEPESKIEAKKNDPRYALRLSAVGEEAKPLPGDFCLSLDLEQIGRVICMGFIDPENSDLTEDGEKLIYSRDQDGAIVAKIHLKKDGTIQVDTDKDLVANVGGRTTLESVGDVDLTAPNVNIIGNLNVSKKIVAEEDILSNNAAAAVSLTNHFHIGNLGYNTDKPIPDGSAGTPQPSPKPDGTSGDLDMNGKDVINIGGAGTNYSTHGHEQGSDSNGDSEVKTSAPS